MKLTRGQLVGILKDAADVIANHTGLEDLPQEILDAAKDVETGNISFGNEVSPDERYFSTTHPDGTVSYWSVVRQQWIRGAFSVSDEDLAAMSQAERSVVRRHLGYDSL